jgi:hypothetical protein
MKNMSELYRKSNKIFRDNITWLITSDIRIKDGKNKGALYGWKNLSDSSFPFVYSEITGYAITAFVWLYSEIGDPIALRAAKEASEWIKNNMNPYLVVARLTNGFTDSTPSELLYSFDNGMIMIGLINMYRQTGQRHFLGLAKKIMDSLIRHFFDGEKLIARLDNCYGPLTSDSEGNIVKWSTISGAYHCKLSVGLLELAKATHNELYKEVSNSLCEYAIKLQKSNGQFITNPGSNISYLHPHLYACEGLIYSGLKQSNDLHYGAGINGIRWAIEKLLSKNTPALCRDTQSTSVEQSDCTAQLLRLLILCRSTLRNYLKPSVLENTAERLLSRLFDFYIPTGDGKGAMRYQLALETGCSWCTMFSMQALRVWTMRNSKNPTWIDYFV